MKLIDFHAHVYPAAIARMATQSVCDFYELQSDNAGTPEEKLDLDRLVGICKTLLLPVSVSPKHTRSANAFVAEQMRLHPEFIAFGTVHPADADLPAQLEENRRLGLVGIKLHPDMQKINADDPLLFPLYDALQGREPLYLHAGDPRTGYSHPARIRHILQTFPRLTVVAAHMGSWQMQDIATPLLSCFENCIVDTSSALSWMPAEKAASIINAYGADRVFFGTDYPVGDPVREANAFAALPLRDGDREKIAYLNAERFFRDFGFFNGENGPCKTTY